MASLHILTEFTRRATINESGDNNIGSATSNKPVSASQLLSTLAPVAVIAVVFLIIFIWARPRFSWNYAPRSRSRLLQDREHTPPLSSGLFTWFKEFWAVSDTVVLQKSSLDAFFFLRLLKMSVVTCLVGSAITWPILFPINATGTGGAQQLNILAMGNIGEGNSQTFRYFAHVGCAYIFFGFVLLMITRESIYYINMRQAYLMNPGYARKLPSRTVLYTAVPNDYLDEARLRETLGPHVKRVWFPTDTDKLDELVKERTKAGMTLEAAETTLIRTANAARIKAGHTTDDPENGRPQAHADNYVAKKDRPSHKVPFLIGKKVDSIEWGRSEIARLDPIIEEEQARHRSGTAKKWNSVFVEFDSLSEAQSAYQSLTHHQILKMAPRYTGMSPKEIIWDNLKIQGWQRFVRLAVTISIVVATVIFWSIPVAFIGVISHIEVYTNPASKSYAPWLGWLNKLPTPIFGVVSGLLPVILLALLMSLLPPFLRFMARLGGSPTTADIEYVVSNYFFAFQVVQVFLVTTLSSGAASAAAEVVQNPTKAVDLLSTALPAANNFYLSYIILQGLGVFAGVLSALAGLVVRPLMATFLGGTPRKLFIQWNKLTVMEYGTLFPIYTNLLVIAIAYSIIAPLVTGLSAIGLFLFYFAYRYNVLYVYSTGPDTKGKLYPRALQQLFVGLYIAEICIIGLLAVSIKKGPKGATAPFAFMIILLVITALYHVSLNAAISPLLDYLPKSLDAEERKAADIAAGKYTAADNSLDSEGGKGDAEIAKVTSTLSAPPQHPKANILTRFLKPHIYNDYATMRALMPFEVQSEEEIDPVIARDAYLAPSVWNELPRLIVPRDPAGISGIEVTESGKVVAITDAGATLDEKNKIVLDENKMSELYFKEKEQRMGYDV